MVRLGTAVFLMLVVTVVGATPADAAAQAQTSAGVERRVDCASLTGLQMPNVRITEAVAVAAPATGAIKVAHCRVSGIIDTETRFRALLPDGWNGRFFAGGGGGFAGSVDNQAEGTVNQGYATAGTDTGHQAAGGDGRWAANNLERVMNYAHRGIHRTTEVTKSIIKAYYGRDPQYSYFYGCSNAGRQALMEVQRYPDDYDGVVSGAPAIDFTKIIAGYVRNMKAVFPNPRDPSASVVTPDNLKLLEAKVLEACDARDGVKDGVLDDPRTCDFKVTDLPACPMDQPAANCVTRSQRTAIERIYAPVMAGDENIYPGQPFGGEGQTNGWAGWITGGTTAALRSLGVQSPTVNFGFGVNFFKYFVLGGKDWDYSTYDLARWPEETRTFASILNADNSDISAFKARKGKLIMSHGWSDPSLNAMGTVAYYERALRRDPNLPDYARLFMMPGVLHCGGGPGPDAVDWFTPIVDWVERGRAPENLLAQKLAPNGSVTNARPLCPYPQRAAYDGKGVTTQAASYSCQSR